MPLFQRIVRGLDFTQNSTTLQVITKASHYVIQPGEEYSSTWHVEGFPSECIIASGIYYYSTDGFLADPALLFRKPLDDSPSMDEPNHKKIGFVGTPQGRGIVFDNIRLQHKVKNLKNSREQSTKVGVRKILCFWLVDPSKRIVSTRDVPFQKWDDIKIEVAIALCIINKKFGRGIRVDGILPVELLVHIMSFVKWGFGKKEAEVHRDKSMRERRFYVDNNNIEWERVVDYATGTDGEEE